MSRFYIIAGLLVCGAFAYCGVTGDQLMSFGAGAGARPTGPGQHFHK